MSRDLCRLIRQKPRPSALSDGTIDGAVPHRVAARDIEIRRRRRCRAFRSPRSTRCGLKARGSSRNIFAISAMLTRRRCTSDVRRFDFDEVVRIDVSTDTKDELTPPCAPANRRSPLGFEAIRKKGRQIIMLTRYFAVWISRARLSPSRRSAALALPRLVPTLSS